MKLRVSGLRKVSVTVNKKRNGHQCRQNVTARRTLFCRGKIRSIYKPLSGRPDIWYRTNIELFDYEDVRKRLRLAANRAPVYNLNDRAVSIRVDGVLREVPPGQLLSLVAKDR